jgi:hypothetical protein
MPRQMCDDDNGDVPTWSVLHVVMVDVLHRARTFTINARLLSPPPTHPTSLLPIDSFDKLPPPLPQFDRLCLVSPNRVITFLSIHQSRATTLVSPCQAAPQLSFHLPRCATTFVSSHQVALVFASPYEAAPPFSSHLFTSRHQFCDISSCRAATFYLSFIFRLVTSRRRHLFPFISPNRVTTFLAPHRIATSSVRLVPNRAIICTSHTESRHHLYVSSRRIASPLCLSMHQSRATTFVITTVVPLDNATQNVLTIFGLLRLFFPILGERPSYDCDFRLYCVVTS